MFLFLKQNPLDKLSSFFAGSFRIFYLTEMKSNFCFNHTNGSQCILKQVNLYGPVSSYVSCIGTVALLKTATGIQVCHQLPVLSALFLLSQPSHRNLFKDICLKESLESPLTQAIMGASTLVLQFGSEVDFSSQSFSTRTDRALVVPQHHLRVWTGRWTPAAIWLSTDGTRVKAAPSGNKQT